MTIIKALLAGLAALGLCLAQTNVTISGKVTDSTSVTPISGATVRLEKGGLPTTSGSDGSFTITGTIVGIITPHFNKTLSGKIAASLHNGYMSLSLREKADVEIWTYTIQGKALALIRKSFAVGNHSVALPITAAGVCFYRIKAGNEEFVLKNNSHTGGSRGAALSNQGTSPTALSRQAMGYVPINDVIKVEKDGYLNYGVIVTKSDTSGIVIKMLPSAGTITDIDGNVYQTVKIGKQIWTVENFRTTKYNDGSDIPLVTDGTAWMNLTTPGYCWYNNDATNKAKYGALYNWYAVNPANPKKIASAGWHVPTDAEWDILQNYLIANGYNWGLSTMGNKIAKAMATKTDWIASTSAGATGNNLSTNNRSGFSALPGGYRNYDGTFSHQRSLGYWWSATELDASYAYSRNLYYGADSLFRNYYLKSCGFSERLLRD